MRNSFVLFSILTIFLASVACRPATDEMETEDSAAEPTTTESAPTTGFAAEFAIPIEEAHGHDAWELHEAVATDLVVEFGGKRIVDGTMLFATDMSRSRLDLENGTVAIFDGKDAWVSPASAEFPRARFHLLTWSYFLSAPMKLRDPGANLEDVGEKELEGETYDAARMTFDPGVGDTPDDWYVVYGDRETDRLAAMAYIVTYGTKPEDAEPHAIVYQEFEEIEGVQIATEWTFRLWSESEGIHGDPIGRASLDNVRFVPLQEERFEVPEDARKDELPEPTT